METSTTMDTNAPSGESLESFLESVRVDALRANLSSIQNSSDYLSIAIFAENKLNCLSNFMFPDINVSNNISVDLIKIIEEARLKFSILKHQEMKDDLNQFTNLCQSWGIQNPATQTPFVLAKPRQRKNSLPGETSKKQKLEATTCQNKFSVLYIEDPPEELQIDEPLPPSPTPEKTTTKPKKKHGPSKKPASLANKQPPAPTPKERNIFHSFIMEENNNSDFESELQYSGESSTSHSGQPSNNHLHVKSRDRKNKKRSRAPENDWNKPFKNKDTSERIKIQKTNDVKDDNKHHGNQPYDDLDTAQMPNTLHQSWANTISPTPTIMYPPPTTGLSIILQFFPNTPIGISKLVLTPPVPGEIRNRRQKPDGCRTVYVGNLPEKMTEEMVFEVFQRFGNISTIRMNNRHFCHIRFEKMESVEEALLLSGYQIKIENNDEPAYNGKLLVDYARDDQRDFECRIRQMKREERHRARDTFIPSPPPMPLYSEHEAVSVNEELCNRETFKKGVAVLITWFEKGECTRRNSGIFYSMLQIINNNVKGFKTEMAHGEEEARIANEKLDTLTRNIQGELSEIGKVHRAANVQKNWDQFSKNQRKYIKEWEEEMKTFSATLLTKRVEEDMDLDLDENDVEKCNNEEIFILREELSICRKELGMCREELDACREELVYSEGLAAERKKTIDKNDEEILRLKQALEKSLEEIREISAKDRLCTDDTQNISVTNSSTQCISDLVNVTESDIFIAALISIFLNAHPKGAHIDYICSYLFENHSPVNESDARYSLAKFPYLFKEIRTGIGATLQKKWNFIAFKSNS
ncbi:ecto-NOX disulfide-thiol exchanger 1 [Nephila pilipes]|uniref:Ecto-NOX disulfide-thiol exchanger 1 n=1 Tax=Nephila pilipes TaxID=299642 RepID=A0A8X6MRN0_NEPPI|nr:ecto-NOX disulfide-thiol exchanger 1 [Nephila pilipes]